MGMLRDMVPTDEIALLFHNLNMQSKRIEKESLKAVDPHLSFYLNGKSEGLNIALEKVSRLIRKESLNSETSLEMSCCAEGDLPAYAHEGDAGMDIRSSEYSIIHRGEYEIIHTGLHIECPEGHVAYVMPRSGLAVKNGITVLNAPGVVDSGYRGEIVVPLINLGREVFEVEPGDRIAQLIISPYTQVKPYSVSSLSDSDRGSDGLGSTGVK